MAEDIYLPQTWINCKLHVLKLICFFKGQVTIKVFLMQSCPIFLQLKYLLKIKQRQLSVGSHRQCSDFLFFLAIFSKVGVLCGSVVKCLTHNLGALGSSNHGSYGFIVKASIGKTLRSLSLVLVKPRKDKEMIGAVPVIWLKNC